jgi:polysaccharide pyruvyl transferase WcaK-like protein
LIVHHYFPVGTDNIGDSLVAHAIRQAVRRHFGPAEFVDMPVNDFSPSPAGPIGLVDDNVDRANTEADLVIVGGSNLLEPRALSQRARQHWGVLTDLVSIHRLNRPLLLLGMGTGSGFARPIRRWSRQACEEIRLLHAHAFASAVRDQTTADRLASIGVTAASVGCPVTFLTDRPVRPADASLPLIVSFPPARILKSVLGKLFMAAAMQYVQGLIRSGVPVVVTLHAASDLAITRAWVPSNVELFYSDDVDKLVARYEASRGVIGFRLHAALLGLGLGKPVIPVGLDWRGLGFIQTFGLEEYSIRSLRLGQFRRLRQLTDRLLSDDMQLLKTLDRAKSYFQPRFEDFLGQAAARFHGSNLEDKLPCLAADYRVLQFQNPAQNVKKYAA